jgi:uncharacterized repeat protein (TIGR03806 family)
MRPLLPLLLLACKDKADTGPGGDPAWGYAERPENSRCLGFDRPPSTSAVQLETAFADLDLRVPLHMIQAPGDPDHWYAMEKRGTVQRFADDDATTELVEVLDMQDRVDASASETGLLGMAFHPDFETNGQLYLSYTSNEGGLHSVISRVTSADGGLSFDPDSEEILLTVDQPYDNHNGAPLEFGPDGYLYIGFGDGGLAGDPEDNGQDTFALLAKILRIDVDGGLPYAIPSDNPFADGEGGAPEVYAWGMRNPWKITFDRTTGLLWAGDVGQNRYEEVDIIENGGNYGWNEKEGFHCYGGGDCEGPYVDPVVEYEHDRSGGKSITGGYVYRGSAIPSLVGAYIYGDYVSGRVWALRHDSTGAAYGEELLSSGLSIVSFAQAQDGEMYVLDYNGVVKRLAPAEEGADSTNFPALLSETGCVDPADPSRLDASLIPYSVNAPFWSDGAEKERWFAIPDGAVITMDEEGDLELPMGSVVMKRFTRGGQVMETRLLVKHEDGEWGGYSYAWRADGSDADYVPGGAVTEVGGGDWLYPSSADCLTCHSAASGRTLGLEQRQLDRDHLYDNGVEVNQLDQYAHIGILESAPVDSVEPLPDPLDEAAPLDQRARSYLHSNCSFCHREGAVIEGLDLHWDSDLSSACEVEPDHGDLDVEGALLLVPGDPELSLIALRMKAEDINRMPPSSSLVVDEEGVALVEQWISGLSACPE